MVYTSLTEAPHNLKEGIDWLIALKGKNAGKSMEALGDALHKFLADKPVGKMQVPALENVKKISKEFMEQEEVKDLWPASELLVRFNKPMNRNLSGFAKFFNNADLSDHHNVVKIRRVKPTDIAKKVSELVGGCEKFLEKIKVSDKYKSAYSSEATWDASCANDPEACAVVFVGIAPMLYTGLRSLKHASNTDPLVRLRLKKKNNSFARVFKAAGYNETECRDKISGSDVFKALQKFVSFRMLVTLYDLSGFWAFY
ncbi:hypothetical protein, conserved [Babesia ovata]|uniref:Uncharacterized protein n=1 Tax=Babesia ovata TaxID=189622 RepID=A0A2H6KGD5_9APIC|nr:uncharacterized protein BOVATA_035510 [Babesia ovata]GBE62058.1 hypothetical protein, conserved [Babesia ovata]